MLAAVFDLSWRFWLFILAQFSIPLYQKQMLGVRRNRAFHGFEQRRKTRLITMIHRQETMSFLGFPIARYIDIEDAEQVLRAVRLTPPDMPTTFFPTLRAVWSSRRSRSLSPSSVTRAMSPCSCPTTPCPVA